jgi:hypothetical protein
MHILELKILPHQYSIHRLLPKYKLPDLLYRKNSFFSFTSTDDEKSLICESSFDIKDSVRDEIFLIYNTTILVNEPSSLGGDSFDPIMIIIPITLIIGFSIFVIRRRKKAILSTN